MKGRRAIMNQLLRVVSIGFLFFALIVCGCQSTYYAVWEKLGKEKRHLLKSNVGKARTEQEEASEKFKDVLTRVKEIYGFKGGDLEKFYNNLKDDYESCEKRAERVTERIEQVEQIASDLFMEWQSEIDEMSNEKLKIRSRQSLRDTKKRYARLRNAMINTKSKMAPVLQHLKDYVLYLKHNLNAQALGALEGEVSEIETEVEALIRDMRRSITEADDFIKSLAE